MDTKTLSHLIKYIHHDLDEGARADFEAHLDRCPVCQNFMESFGAMLKSYEKLTYEQGKALTADYLMAKMPAELSNSMKHLEEVPNFQGKR